MSRKSLNQRLDGLFSSIALEPEAPAPVATPATPVPARQATDVLTGDVWQWSTDTHGNYNSLGGAVQSALGIQVEDFLGQPLGAFALHPHSAQLVRAALQTYQWPQEIPVRFIGINGEVPARMYIISGGNGSGGGLQGFVQLIDASASPDNSPKPLATVPTDQTSHAKPPKSAALPSHLLAGIRVEAGQVAESAEPLTSVASSSMEAGQFVVTKTGQNNIPVIAAPIRLNNQAAGVLELVDDDPQRSWSEDERLLVEEVIDQLSLALENAQLFQEVQDSARRNEALYEASRRLSPASTLEDILKAVVEGVPVEIIQRANLWELELDANGKPHALAQIADWSANPEATLLSHHVRLPFDEYTTLQGTLGNQPVLVEDIRQKDKIDAHTFALIERLGGRSAVMIPLWSGDKQLGVLNLISGTPGAFSTREIQPYTSLASQVAVVIENQRLFEQTRQALEETETLYSLSGQLNSAASIEDILQALIIPNTAGDRPFGVTLWLFENDAAGNPEWMTLAYSWMAEGHKTGSAPGTRLYLPDYPGAQLMFSNPFDPILFDDVSTERMDRSTRRILKENHANAVAFLPLSIQNRWIGQVSILWAKPTAFNERDRQRYRSLAAQSAVTVNNRLQYESSEKRAQQLEWLSLIKDSLSQASDENGILFAVSMAADMAEPPAMIQLSYIDLDESGVPQTVSHQSFWSEGFVYALQPEDQRPFGMTELENLGFFQHPADELLSIPDLQQSNSKQSKPGAAYILPMSTAGRLQGLIAFIWDHPHQLSGDESFYLSELIEPVSAIIATRRAYLSEQVARQAMERRNVQLQTAAQVSQAASSMLDPDELVAEMVEIIRQRFDLYYVGLFLVDQDGQWTGEANKWAVLRAGTGGAGQEMIHRQHKLALGSGSMIGGCIADGEGHVWRGLDDDVDRMVNPLLPRTRSEMALPLRARGQVIGAMTFQSERPGDFSEADIAVLQTMSDQVANALENARLYAQAQAALSETSTLLAVASSSNRTLELKEMLEDVLAKAVEAAGLDAGLISIFDTEANDLSMVCETGLPAELAEHFRTNGLAGTLCALVFEQQETIILSDMTRYAPLNVSRLLNLGIRAYMGAPITSKGTMLGTLCAFRNKPLSPRESDPALLEAIGQQLGIAIENTNLFNQTQQALSETELLYTASAELNTAASYADIVGTLANHTILGHNQAIVSINLFDRPYDPQQPPDWINIPVSLQTGESKHMPARYPSILIPSLWKIVRADTVSVINDTARDEQIDSVSRQVIQERFHARSAVIVPLVVGGSWIGFLSGAFPAPHTFQTKDIRRISALANQASVAIQNLQSLEVTRQQAREATLLFQTSQQLVQSRNENEIFQSTLQASSQISAVDYVGLLRFKEVAEESYLEQAAHLSNQNFNAPENGTLFPVQLYTFTQLVRNGQSVISDDISNDLRMDDGEKELLSRLNMRSLAALPVRLRGEVVALLIASYAEAHSFSLPEIRFLETVVVQLGIALDNHYLLQETQRRARQLQTAAEVSQAVNSLLDPDQLIQKVVDLVQERFDLYYVGLFIVDQNGQWSGEPNRWAVLRAGSGVAGLQMKAQGHKLALDGGSMIGACILQGQAQIALNVAQMPGRYQNPLLPRTASEMALPLIAQGERLGAISIQSDHQDAFNQDDIATLQTMADQVAIALQNARLFGQTQTALQETELLYNASAEINIAEGYQEILDTLARHTVLGTNPTLLSLNLFESPWTSTSRPRLVSVPARRAIGVEDTFSRQYPLDSIPQIDKVIFSDRPSAFENLDALIETSPGLRQQLLQSYKAVSALYLPLVVGGQWIGFVQAVFAQLTRFPESELRRLNTLASQAAVALQNLQSLELAEQRAQEAQKRSDQLALVNRVVADVSASLDLEKALNVVTGELTRALNIRSSVALINANRSGLVVMAEQQTGGVGTGSLGLTVPMTNNPAMQRLLETRQPLIIDRAGTNPLTAQFHNQLRQRGISTYYLFPIVVNDTITGTVSLEIDSKTRRLSDDEYQLAQTVVLQAATAIQNARLFEQTQEALSEMEVLYEANSELNRAQGYEDVLTILRRHSVLGHENTHLVIQMFDRPWTDDETPQWLLPLAAWHAEQAADLFNSRTRLADWRTARMLLQPNLATFVTDLEHDARLDERTRQMFGSNNGSMSLLFAPLNVAGNWIGHVFAVYAQPLDFDESDLRRMSTLVGQAAVVIENIRSTEVTRQRAAQLEKLSRIQAALSHASDAVEIVNALSTAASGMPAPGNISLYFIESNSLGQPDTMSLAATWQNAQARPVPNAQPTAFQDLPAARLLLARPDETLLVSDLAMDNRFESAARKAATRSRINAMAMIPLRTAGMWTGLVAYTWNTAVDFGDDAPFLLRRILEPASEAVARYRAFIAQRRAMQESQRRALQLQTAAEIARDTASILAPQDLLTRAVNLVSQHYGLYHTGIYLIDEDAQVIRLHAAAGAGSGQLLEEQVMIPLSGRSLHSQAVTGGQARLVGDLEADSIYQPHPLMPETRSQLVIPLKVGNRILGVLDAQSALRDSFGEEDLAALQTLADQLAVALDNARSYEEQRQTAERLQEVDTLKTQFLANMSHELRTPLNSIIGFSRVILKGIDGPVTDLQEQDLNAIYNSGQHLLSLINDILDLSKIEAGKMELALEDININDMIHSVMSTAVGLTKEKSFKLDRDVEADLPIVRGDRTRLRQVLINLISNAAKFTDDGFVKVLARKQTGANGRPELYIAVQDTGSGISPEDQDKLFRPFSQVDASPTRKTGGTGLGLSISRHLVEMHGGRIGVESTVGVGSTFYFLLPLRPPEEETVSDLQPDERLILAIDDNEQVIQLYQRYLNPHRYRVAALYEPEKAVIMARKLQPYAITLDVMMPGRDGWQVLADLKSNPDTRHIPVIICSIIQDEARSFSLGAVDYLVKPILEDELVDSLRRLDGDHTIKHVLIVDDDPNDLRLAQKIIVEHGGYKVSTAQGGQAGLLALQTTQPDAVLLDLNMPDIDGFTVLETLRADPRLANLPVIIYSGAELDDQQIGRLNEFTELMLKKGSFTEGQFFDTLHRALEHFGSQPPLTEDQPHE